METGLYFHIPFCSSKCDYCHFYVLPNKSSLHAQLMEALRLEWESWQPYLAHKKIATIYFGGGTPSLLGPERIAEILNWIRKEVSFKLSEGEVTLEANPEEITLDLIQSYARAGINRLSFGVQSFDNTLLKTLTRQHSAQKAKEAVWCAAESGIVNVSIDLMYDVPGQTLSSWQRTLEEVTRLPISHLSLYNLTLEPHTVFFKKRHALQSSLPDAQSSAEMYHMAVEVLESCGFKQYEISAFAKQGFQSHHNVGYWTGRPFLGFGPSAFSYWEGKRCRNVANLSKYSKALKEEKSPIDFSEELPYPQNIRELLVIHLRLLEGVDLTTFQYRHAPLNKDTMEKVEKLMDEGLLQKQRNHLSLTKQGVLFYDFVAVELI